MSDTKRNPGRGAKTSPPAASDPVAPDWPTPPEAEAYHGLAGDVVRAIAPTSEADPVALLVQLLVMFGNVVGRGPHFAVEGDRHHTNEFAVVVGPTAAGRKGTSFGRVRQLFDPAEKEWLDHRVQSGVSSGEGVIWAVRDPIRRQERTPQGAGQPATFTSVEVDAGEPDKRLLVYEPEFANVLRQGERNGNTASATLRQMWDGREVVGSLVKNSPAKATAAHVSMVGHITPEELNRYLTATETANGFTNRILFTCVRKSKSLPDGGRMDPARLPLLQARLSDAIEFARGVGEARRHDDARDLWHAVYPLLSAEQAGMFGALTGRAAPHVLRLAMLYAILERSAAIRPEHLMAGLALWDYCERSLRFLFGDRTGEAVADDALAHLRAAGEEGLTRDELRNLFGRNRSSEELGRSLAALERGGLARRAKQATGGRPVERWTAVTGTTSRSPLMAAARVELAIAAGPQRKKAQTGETDFAFGQNA